MRKNVEKVLRAFNAGKPCNGDSKKTCSTDGQAVYSYAMPIAWRNEVGDVVVVDYKVAPSATTRSHVRACEQFTFTPGDSLSKVARDKLGLASERAT